MSASPARFSLSQLECPIVAAPLAGGPSTPALAAAVSAAGGLGFLAAGYRSPEAVRGDIAELRRLTDRPYGIGLFVPASTAASRDEVARYAESLRADAARYGVEPGSPEHDDDAWAAKLDLMDAAQPAVVSFTFGCPPDDVVARLHTAGCAVWITVTTAREARRAAAAGADALVAQGAEAGGHRASFDLDSPGEIGLLALLQIVTDAVSTPVVASGGLMTGRAIAAALVAGAEAVQLGSAFMLCPEAGTSPAQRAALLEDADTAVTRAFTGRAARGIVNRFLREHSDDAPMAYPEVHHVTAPIRAAARERGDAEALNLWAGQAHVLARQRPAGELVRELAEEARAALRHHM